MEKPTFVQMKYILLTKNAMPSDMEDILKENGWSMSEYRDALIDMIRKNNAA